MSRPPVRQMAIDWLGMACYRAHREYRRSWIHRLPLIGPRLKQKAINRRVVELIDYKGRRFPLTDEVVEEAAMAGIELQKEPHS